MIVSRVRVVALPSDLFRYSKSWCFVYVFGVDGVVCFVIVLLVCVFLFDGVFARRCYVCYCCC